MSGKGLHPDSTWSSIERSFRSQSPESEVNRNWEYKQRASNRGQNTSDWFVATTEFSREFIVIAVPDRWRRVVWGEKLNILAIWYWTECKSGISSEGIAIWQAESNYKPKMASNSSGSGQISTVLNLKTWFLGSQNSATTWRNEKLIFLACIDRNTDRWNGVNLNQDSPPKLFKTGCKVLKLLSDFFWGFSEDIGGRNWRKDEEGN